MVWNTTVPQRPPSTDLGMAFPPAPVYPATHPLPPLFRDAPRRIIHHRPRVRGCRTSSRSDEQYRGERKGGKSRQLRLGRERRLGRFWDHEIGTAVTRSQKRRNSKRSRLGHPHGFPQLHTSPRKPRRVRPTHLRPRTSLSLESREKAEQEQGRFGPPSCRSRGGGRGGMLFESYGDQLGRRGLRGCQGAEGGVSRASGFFRARCRES